MFDYITNFIARIIIFKYFLHILNNICFQLIEKYEKLVSDMIILLFILKLAHQIVHKAAIRKLLNNVFK